jgi:antirestriction protein ArdC
VTLPPPERFDTAEHYYATAFHELTHATGAKHRLNRGLGKTIPPFGSADYSKEELVAEMGAAFLSAVAGISAQTIEASASYINGWRNRLQDDKRLVVAAAGQAQRAADLILGTHWSDTDQDSATVQAITGACDHTPPSSGPARSFTPSR